MKNVMINAIAGPLAYFAGAELGGVIIAAPVAGFTALALGWATFMPLLIRLSTRLDGMQPLRVTAEA